MTKKRLLVLGIAITLIATVVGVAFAQAPRAACGTCHGNQTVMRDVTFNCNLCDRGYVTHWERGPQCRTCRGTGNEEQSISNPYSGTQCRTCPGSRGTMDRQVRSRCQGCGGQGQTRDRIAVMCPTCKGTGTRP